MTNLTHAELVERAARWLYKTANCGVVLIELVTVNHETPDAIGFRSDCSILVEAKASRSDFFADKRKSFRWADPGQGMGDWRFYLCEPHVIRVEDALPDRFGLLHVVDGRVRRVRGGPEGNAWCHVVERANTHAELRMAISALRRIKLRGLLDRIYEPAPELRPSRIAAPASTPPSLGAMLE